MSGNLNLLVLALLACFSFAFSSQRCYDCDPQSEGSCISPETHAIKVTNCEESSETSSTDSPVEFECFTLYANAGGNKTGFYRGCTPKSINFTTSCDILKEELGSYNVTLCKTCSIDKCNTVYLPEPKVDDTDPSDDNSNSGVAEHSLKFGIILIGVATLVQLYFTGFN